MAADPRCKVEVGSHPGPFWKDLNSGLFVCDRHRAQFEERADEFGPFLWTPQVTDPHPLLVERFEVWLSLGVVSEQANAMELAQIATDFYQEIADGRAPDGR